MLSTSPTPIVSHFEAYVDNTHYVFKQNSQPAQKMLYCREDLGITPQHMLNDFLNYFEQFSSLDKNFLDVTFLEEKNSYLTPYEILQKRDNEIISFIGEQVWTDYLAIMHSQKSSNKKFNESELLDKESLRKIQEWDKVFKVSQEIKAVSFLKQYLQVNLKNNIGPYIVIAWAMATGRCVRFWEIINPESNELELNADLSYPIVSQKEPLDFLLINGFYIKIQRTVEIEEDVDPRQVTFHSEEDNDNSQSIEDSNKNLLYAYKVEKKNFLTKCLASFFCCCNRQPDVPRQHSSGSPTDDFSQGYKRLA